MKVRWTNGLDEQNTKDIKQLYKESLRIRQRLNQMLVDIIEEKRKGQTLESHYDSPNWAYHQADRVGYERAIRDVIELISEK